MGTGKKRITIFQLVVGFLGAMLGLLLVAAFNQNILMRLSLLPRMASSVVVYWVIAIIPFAVMVTAKDHLSDYGFEKENLSRQIVMGIAIGVLTTLVLTLLPHLLGLGNWVDNGKRYLYVWQFVYEMLFSVCAVGLTEEFVFRGFLFGKVKQLGGSNMAAAVVSSILFGLFHILNGNIVQMIITGLMGMFWCICRKKLRSCTTLSLIIAHGIHDWFIVLLASVFLS